MLKRLLYIGDEIFGVLNPDAHSEEAVGNPDLGPFVGSHVRVRAVARLDHERIDAAEACRVGEQLESLHEPDHGLASALELDWHHPPESIEQSFGDLVIGMARKSGVMHLCDLCLL